MTDTKQAFTLTKQDSGIAILSMDVPNESMNILKAQFADEIDALLNDIQTDTSIKGIVLTSGKENSFMAGADVSMLAACTSAQEATDIARGGQAMFCRITDLTIPVIAATDRFNRTIIGGSFWTDPCHHKIDRSVHRHRKIKNA